MNRSLYEVLEVSRDATSDEIEQAALTMGEQFRPDRNPDDPIAKRRFEEIERAFAVLRDPVARANYDINAPRKADSPAGGRASRASDHGASDEAGAISSSSTAPSASTRTCPICQERVHIDALKCKQCGTVLLAQPGEMTFVGMISMGFGVLMLLFAVSAMEKSAIGAMLLVAIGVGFGWVGLIPRRRGKAAHRLVDPEVLASEPIWRKPLHEGWLQSSRMTTLGLLLGAAGLTLAFLGITVGGGRYLGSVLGIGLRPVSLVIGLLTVAGAVLLLRETAILKLDMVQYAKRLAAGVGGLTVGFVAFALIGAIFGFDSPKPAPQAAEPKAPSAAQQSVAPQSSTPTNSDDELNSCFLLGQSLATVYIANVVEAARADVMASDIMREGCQKKAATVPDVGSCIRTCESGFKSRARDLLRR